MNWPVWRIAESIDLYFMNKFLLGTLLLIHASARAEASHPARSPLNPATVSAASTQNVAMMSIEDPVWLTLVIFLALILALAVLRWTWSAPAPPGNL